MYRNVFLLTNLIIFIVAGLLIFFGSTIEGIFLSTVVVFNISMGLFQDVRAWVALNRLQFLTAPHVTRINVDGTESSVLNNDVQKGDLIKLKIGDHVPCDGLLVEAHGFEINQGLITGESNSIPVSQDEAILAGSVVTSGFGVVKIETPFTESRIARMTEGVRKFSTNLSPIQHEVQMLVKVAGYILTAVLAYVLIKAWIGHEPILEILRQVGALTSMLVPVGLIFAVTLFFAYGAAHLFKRHVLLQEVNATEKLGRIKNLCMDKTGTLTENKITVETMLTPDGVKVEEAQKSISAYIAGSIDVSDIIVAVKNFIQTESTPEVIDTVSFSSWRQYGGVHFSLCGKKQVILAGLPDTFADHLKTEANRDWLKKIISENAVAGRRLLCFVSVDAEMIPPEIGTHALSLVAVFVFSNNLRPGIQRTIGFFQNRGVTIRIISGDNPETARAIATAAGVHNADKVVTGKELETWSGEEFAENVQKFSVFARILPEQKEKIVTALKKNGFTAMVGDGANDALAIKQADLGIAMFDGAPATRQLASVVLTNNSFAALPGGVVLADTLIKNIEIMGAVFLSQTFTGLLLFLAMLFLGKEYPLAPLNISFLNYFAVGIPSVLISYWAIRPTGKFEKTSAESYLKRLAPFVVTSGFLQTAGLLVLYILNPVTDATSNIFMVLGFSVLGFAFFASAPMVYQTFVTRSQKWGIALWGIVELSLLIIALNLHWVCVFFTINVSPLTTLALEKTVIVLVVFSLLQYVLAFRFAKHNRQLA
jgi:cation-transporting ATPase E